MALGNAGEGTKEEQRKVAEDSFSAIVMDKTKKSKQIGGVWCVGVFGGGQERVSKVEEQKMSRKRKKTINDGADFDLSEAMQNTFREQMEATHQSFEESCMRMMGDLSHLHVDVPLGLERNPAEAKPDLHAEMTDDIKREVLMQMQRTSKTLSQEEIDEHEAELSVKVQKQSRDGKLGGRPRKTMTELMGDVSKMKRERQNQLQSVVDSVLVGKKLAEDEAKAQFGETMPTEVGSMLTQMKQDTAGLCAAVEAAKAKVGEFDISSVQATLTEGSAADSTKAADTVEEAKEAKEGEGAKDVKPAAAVSMTTPTVDQIRQKLIEDTKQAFKDGVTANRAISSFRTAVKKAATAGSSKKKRVGKKGTAEVVPPLVVKALVEVNRSDDDSANVIACKDFNIDNFHSIFGCGCGGEGGTITHIIISINQ